ncbi:hypothetical protein, partial [Candidatus Nitrosotalea sp. FS]|uniref:hypothetical protein n=1 Tax=Candidatus Nitrosotalea sp. FS TaxID=2341021 RepID=UPI001C49B165
ELQKRFNDRKMKLGKQVMKIKTHKKERRLKVDKSKEPVPMRFWGLVPRFCLDTIPLISLQSHNSLDLYLRKNKKETLT